MAGAEGSAAQRRNTRLLGAGLMLLSAAVGAMAVGDLVSLWADIAAERSPLVVRDAPALMIPCVLAMTWVALMMLVLPGKRWQRRLFGAALASLALLLVVPFAVPRAVLAHGYRSCGRGDPASRFPSDTWVRGDAGQCAQTAG